MCEQCVAHVLSWAALPGWSLVLARTDGNEMKRGEWGLVECNDPTLVFQGAPMVDPSVGLTVENCKKLSKAIVMEHSDRAMAFSQQLVMDPETGYRLVEAGKGAGFGIERSMPWSVGTGVIDEEFWRFDLWLFNFLGKVIRDNRPRDDNFYDGFVRQKGKDWIREMLEAGRGFDPELDTKLEMLDADLVPSYDDSLFIAAPTSKTKVDP